MLFSNTGTTTHQQDPTRIHKPRTLNLAISSLMVSLAIGTTLLPQVANAATLDLTSSQSISIPAGKLSDVLAHFAAVSGVALSFDPTQLTHMDSPGLQGTFTIQQGFSQLLNGTGYELVDTGNGRYSLKKISTISYPDDSTILPPTVVTARTQSNLMAPTRQKTVLEREEIETLRHGGDSLATMLSKVVPGMAGSSHTITDFGQTLRGRDMLILVDGIPLNTNRGSSRNLANINPADIEQLEVLRGSSSIYGSSGAGGIISIRTRQPDGKTRAETFVSGTSSLSNPGASSLGGELQHFISGASNAIDYSLNLGARHIGGSYDANGRRIAPEPSQGDMFDANIYNISAKLGLNIDHNQRLQLSLSHYDARQDTDYASDVSVAQLPPGKASAHAIKGLKLNRQNEIANTLMSLDYQHRDLAGSTLATQLYYRDFFTRFAPFDARAFPNRGSNVDQATQNSHVLGGRLTIKTPFGEAKKTNLTWGADFNQEKTDMPLDVFDPVAFDTSGGLVHRKIGKVIYMPKITTRTTGAFAQLQHRFNPAWAVEAGARYDRTSASFDDFVPLSQSNAANPQAVKGGSIDYGAWTYNAGIVFNPTAQHDIYTSFSQGFELPDIGLQVRNANPSFNIDNSSLQPIKTDSLELGWRGRFTNMTTSLAVFQSESDLGAVQSFNNGLTLLRTKERIHGIEGAMDYFSSDDKWGLGGTVTWMKGRELLQNASQYRDMTGYRIPPLKLTAYAEYRPDSRWSHRLQTIAFAGHDYRLNGISSFGRRDFSGYATVDLISRMKIDDKSNLTIGVENLFNKDYFPLYSQLLRSDTNTSRLPAMGTVLRLSYNYRW